MLRSSWLRVFFASAGAGALVLGAVQCGSSESAGAIGFQPDGGYDAATDAPVDGGPGTHVLAVNASPDLGDFRICFGVGGGFYTSLPVPSDTPMPASNYPGVARGGGTLLPDVSPLWSDAVTVYAIHANRIASDTSSNPGPSCTELLCDPTVSSTCLDPGEYFQVTRPIPAGTLVPGGTYLLAITGCVPAADDTTGARSAGACGGDYSPLAGNLAALVVPLQPGAAGTMAYAAFAQLAPAVDGVLLDDAGPDAALHASYGALDAASSSGTDLRPGAYLTTSPPVPVEIPSTLGAFATTGVSTEVTSSSADGGALFGFQMSLADMARLSAPAEAPNDYFAASNAFVFALVGDPTYAPDAGAASGYDGRNLHILALPVP